jgi:hypothetical protein
VQRPSAFRLQHDVELEAARRPFQEPLEGDRIEHVRVRAELRQHEARPCLRTLVSVTVFGDEWWSFGGRAPYRFPTRTEQRPMRFTAIAMLRKPRTSDPGELPQPLINVGAAARDRLTALFLALLSHLSSRLRMGPYRDPRTQKAPHLQGFAWAILGSNQ